MKWGIKTALLVATVVFISTQCSHAVPQTSSRPPSQSPAAAAPRAPPKNCIKHPPNFQQVNLPCGGYDRDSCLKVCQALGHTSAYCKKEEFCLCHSGNLYSC